MLRLKTKNPVHMLYRNVIYSGVAFGAEKWFSACERLAYLVDSSSHSICHLGGGSCNFFKESKLAHLNCQQGESNLRL